ncbi:hypothetical protein PQ455_01485 [Sphingomonas naphthae]|uniref:DUF5666 domain-containing protein n=1 Tax=Sphingomonas naphthae TaxID=1813468 RepID=A0ABY7TLM4_9SPHN|nr:hypothetical protein [Sphingomonas naphthae]WCT73933.1 hypothetical protein PQ455_01485 [Sphingomonas naphthae]
MTDPFATAAAALFASPLAVAAVFTPAGGAPVAIRVIRDQSDEVIGNIVLAGNGLQVLRASVANPQRGDGITIAGVDYVIQGDPTLDVEGVAWNCALEAA